VIGADLGSGDVYVKTSVLQVVKEILVTNMTAHVRANQASMEDNAIKCVPHNVLITNARMGHVSALRDIMVTIVNSNAM